MGRRGLSSYLLTSGTREALATLFLHGHHLSLRLQSLILSTPQLHGQLQLPLHLMWTSQYCWIESTTANSFGHGWCASCLLPPASSSCPLNPLLLTTTPLAPIFSPHFPHFTALPCPSRPLSHVASPVFLCSLPLRASYAQQFAPPVDYYRYNAGLLLPTPAPRYL